MKAKRRSIKNEKSKKRKKIDHTFLDQFGKHVEELIKKKGFVSPYDFWIQKSDDLFSRAGLHYLLTGKRDVRLTTLRAVAECLGITLPELLTFKDKAPKYLNEDSDGT